MKKVLVFGAFDGLHPGHFDFFKQAKKHGDILIVSVGLDQNVETIKKKKPLFSQDERLALVRGLKIVDAAVLGAKADYYRAIKKLGPDVICLGYDQWASVDDVKTGLKSVGLGGMKVIRLKPYKETRAKSTHLKNKSVDF